MKGRAQESHKPLFTVLEPAHTGIEFVNYVNDSGAVNVFNEESFYNGGGVAIADLNNDDLPDIICTANQGPDQLYLNLGGMRFKDITESSGIRDDGGWSSGVTTADVNGDGYLDIYICKDMYPQPEMRRNKLYINQGDLTFVEMASEYGLDNDQRSIQAYFFDLDKDNDADLYLVNHPANPGYFSDREVQFQIDTTQSSRLYENRNGHFVDITSMAGVVSTGYSLSAMISDFNNDGWVDIYLCNDFVDPDQFFLNNGDGTFTNVINTSVGHITHSSMGSDAADIDNDGWTDMLVLDMVPEDHFRRNVNMGGLNLEQFDMVKSSGGHHQYMMNTLQWNRGVNSEGQLFFSEIGYMAGISMTDWSWSALLSDFNNDGLRDLFVSNGYRIDYRDMDALARITAYSKGEFQHFMDNNPRGSGNFEVWKVLDFDKVFGFYPSVRLPNYIFENTNGLQFAKRIDAWGLGVDSTFSNGAAYGDLDNDGDLDLIANNINDRLSVYRNNSEQFRDRNYLRVKLTGNSGPFVPYGIKVRITYHADGRQKNQYYEFVNARGFQSSSECIAHFGIGAVQRVDQVLICWLDGSYTSFEGVKANQVLVVDSGDDRSPGCMLHTKPQNTLFRDMTRELGLEHWHLENNYKDYVREPLLPHRMSTLGPAIAVGDINGDGLEDIVVGGTTIQPVSFFIQRADHTFEKTSFLTDKLMEDTACALFDADNDGDLDLYIGSGSNEYLAESGYYDRLYLNDGKGAFEKAYGSLPALAESTGVVKAADFDKDGDLDLFVGGRQVPGNYPLPANSYILRNEGLNSEGIPVFSDITAEIAPELKGIGMVTDAIWLDYDMDADDDLILVGEWMPITVFVNEDGTYVNRTGQLKLNETPGWWFSISSGDFDADGDPDLVIGNLGHNHKYQPSKQAPLEIFHHDFDNNGTNDIVISYFESGIRLPVKGLNYSAAQIPSLPIRFPNHHTYAKASLEDIYGLNNLNVAKRHKVTGFASVYAENLGDGQFLLRPLAPEAQVSAIQKILVRDFTGDGHPDILIGGGWCHTDVEIPRNDAGVGLVLKGDGKGNFEAEMPVHSGLYLPEDVRDMSLIKLGERYAVVSASNSGPVLLHEILR